MAAPDRRELGAVFAGGALGTAARAGVAELLPHAAGTAGLPWATLAVNVAGALLLGLVAARAPARGAFLGTGLCGGLTTFSTLQVELFGLLEHGRVATALLYAAISLAAGLAAFAVGARA